MDLIKMISELRAKQRSIEQAILTLERLAGSQKRRGRPPAFLARLAQESAAESPAAKKPKKRRNISPEARERMAEAQRKRWGAYRTQEPGT